MTKDKFQEYIVSAVVSLAGFLTPLIIPLCIILSFDVIDYIIMYRLKVRNKNEVFNKRKHVDRLIAHLAVIAVAFIVQSFMLKEQPVLIIAQGAIGITQVNRIRLGIKRLSGDDLIGELPKINKD